MKSGKIKKKKNETHSPVDSNVRKEGRRRSAPGARTETMLNKAAPTNHSTPHNPSSGCALEETADHV